MDFINAIFQPALLPFTVPLLLALTLWFIALLGLFDFNVFDVDIDADLDVDLDVDVGVDLDTDLDAAGGGFLQILGIGMVPFSLILSLVFFFFGVTGITLHSLLGDVIGWNGWVLNLVFIPVSLFAALGITSPIARLLHPLFRDYGEAQGATTLVGKIAVLKSSTVSPTFGSATLKLEGGTPVEIATRTSSEDHGLKYGDRVLVIDYDSDKNIYFVEPFDEETKT